MLDDRMLSEAIETSEDLKLYLHYFGIDHYSMLDGSVIIPTQKLTEDQGRAKRNLYMMPIDSRVSLSATPWSGDLKINVKS